MGLAMRKINHCRKHRPTKLKKPQTKSSHIVPSRNDVSHRRDSRGFT